MAEKLTQTERERLLPTLDGWSYEPNRDAIVKQYRFADFVEAFAFMTRVALLAEKANHHPEWSNVWNRVDMLLTTHDANGLSMRDIALARAIDQTKAA